jgi:hypothetical protein
MSEEILTPALTEPDPYQPTPAELDKMFSAMDDSVTVIDDKITNGPDQWETQEECNLQVTCNAGHLEIMLSKPYIQDAGRPLTSYENAIVDGKAYIASNGGLVESDAKD